MQFEDTNTPFVGREDDIRKIDAAWLSHKIFVIFGLRAVGKSRLVKEFIDRKCIKITSKSTEPSAIELPNVVQHVTVSQERHSTDTSLKTNVCVEENSTPAQRQLDDARITECNQCEFQVVYLDMLTLKDSIDAIYSNICVSLGVTPEPLATTTDKWKLHIADEIESRKYGTILYFDNAENIVEDSTWDDILSLCQRLADQCSNSKMIFTTTTQFHISQITSIVYTHEVLPLKAHDASALLKLAAPHADLSQCEEDILKCSEGLPLLILMIGSKLEQDGGLITPLNIETMLYPKDDEVADVYKTFLEKLSKTHRDRLLMLEFIPGSFSISEATDLLGLPNDVQTLDQAVIPLRRLSMLHYDPTTRRFDIQGVLRECIRAYFATNNTPELRARYSKTFTRVMRGIVKTLGTVEYTRALSEFTIEQPNLQKLLQDVLLTNEDTYHFVIDVTEKCTDLIEMFMRSESEKFYDGCLQLADRYGREGDKAAIHIAVGSLATNLIGDLPRGAARYESALQVLGTERNSLLLAKVYQRMGWNLYRQGRNVDAIRYFKKSLDISTYSGNEFHIIYLQSLNSMGVAHTDLGNLEEAQKYHFQSLELRKQLLGEDHPMLGATLNNIGVFYEQKGEPEKALEYYLKGLELKRNGNLPTSSLIASADSIAAPTAIVDSLTNIAMANNDLKQWESAHKLLDEAMNILNMQKITLKDSLALTYDTRGKVFMSEGKYVEASEMFEKASEIRKAITLSGIAYFESQMHLAQAQECQGKYTTCLQIVRELLQLQTKVIETMPENSLIIECLECLERIYEKTDEEEKCLNTLTKIQTELLRLENVRLSQQNERQVEKIRQQLNVLNLKIKNMECPHTILTC